MVVVFDADHAPRRDFLVKTLGYFEDDEVGFVQTPQDFYNLDSYQHRWRGKGRTVWTEQALFFRVIQRGKDYWNAAFFCGSCAIVRRSVLDEIGGFATGTVTEDLHTSLRIHAAAYKSVYHAEPLAFGLAPESIEPFIGQRVRWGQGAMHVWRKEGILSHRGLSLAQRLNYLASALTYFDGWQKGIFYFAPAVVLLTGLLPLLATTPEFLLHFLPYYLLTFWVFEEAGRGYGRSLFIEQYNMARFAAFAWATLALIFPRMKFRVTAKGAGASRSAIRFTAPQWAVLAINGLALPVGAAIYMWSEALPLQSLVANGLWACINAALAPRGDLVHRDQPAQRAPALSLPGRAAGRGRHARRHAAARHRRRPVGHRHALLRQDPGRTGDRLQADRPPAAAGRRGAVLGRGARPDRDARPARRHQGARLRVRDQRGRPPSPRGVPVRLRPASGC
jgi:cellulose synthase (UDP-forming)